MRQDKEHYIQQQCEKTEKGLTIGNTRQACSLIKVLRRKFTPRLNIIRGQESRILQSQENTTERWAVYCNNLYKHH